MLHPALNLPALIYTPGRREQLQDESVFPKNTRQSPQPGLQPGPFDLDLSALTMRPPYLQYFLINNGHLNQNPDIGMENFNQSCVYEN